MPRTTEEIYKGLLEKNLNLTPQNQQNLNRAMGTAAAFAQTPKSSAGWLGQMQGYLKQIQDKGSYQFKPEESGLWQAYKDQYVNAGQRAMKDTMGQAAGLTGGYGNTYAQAAGQQQYNQYLTQLNAMLPQVAEQERAAWNADLDALYRQMDAAGDMYSRLYAKERDALADQRYADELEYARGRDALADQRYADELEYARGRDALADQRYADELAYGRQRDAISDQRYAQEREDEQAYRAWQQQQAELDRQADEAYRKWQMQQAELERTDSQAATTRKYAYDLAMEMISRGLTPDAGTLQAAGLTLADAQKLAASYAAQLAGYGTGGGSGGGGGGRSSGGSSRSSGSTPSSTPKGDNPKKTEQPKTQLQEIPFDYYQTLLSYAINYGEDQALALLNKKYPASKYDQDKIRKWMMDRLLSRGGGSSGNVKPGPRNLDAPV